MFVCVGLRLLVLLDGNGERIALFFFSLLLRSLSLHDAPLRDVVNRMLVTSDFHCIVFVHGERFRG